MDLGGLTLTLISAAGKCFVLEQVKGNHEVWKTLLQVTSECT